MSAPGVLVLGMHRSGTSAATRVVADMGLAASRPDDAVRGPWNPKGHYESRSLMHLDDKLLAEMGCTWWSPPPAGDAYWEAAARLRTGRRAARQVFHRSYGRRGWVWKDPRACLLLPFWRSVLGAGVPGIVVLRDPLEVARSLEQRNETSVAFGLALWERYHRLVVAHAEGMPLLVTRFDDLMADPARWADEVAAFLRKTGLALHPPTGGPLTESVDPALRHSRSEVGELDREAPATGALHNALDALVGAHRAFVVPDLGPEPAVVQATLDALGPARPPGWRPPPWATHGGGASATGTTRD